MFVLRGKWRGILFDAEEKRRLRERSARLLCRAIVCYFKTWLYTRAPARPTMLDPMTGRKTDGRRVSVRPSAPLTSSADRNIVWLSKANAWRSLARALWQTLLYMPCQVFGVFGDSITKPSQDGFYWAKLLSQNFLWTACDQVAGNWSQTCPNLRILETASYKIKL